MDRNSLILVDASYNVTDELLPILEEENFNVKLWKKPHQWDAYGSDSGATIDMYEDLIKFANEHKIYAILFSTVADIAPTANEAQEVFEWLDYELLFPFALDLPPKLLKHNAPNMKIYNYHWDFQTYLKENNINIEEQSPEFIESLRASYEDHIRRSRLAYEQGFGHKEGETIIHHDKAEKKEFLAENHKEFGGTMNNKQVMDYYRSRGLKFSNPTIKKYLNELRNELGNIDL